MLGNCWEIVERILGGLSRLFLIISKSRRLGSSWEVVGRIFIGC